MTTQQPEEAAVGNESQVELSPEDRLNAVFDDPQNHIEQEPEEAVEGEQPEASEEAEDEIEIEAEEEELPPIDAPISWDAEAKAVFAGLPREAQEIVSKREAERERFVQSKSQEAKQAAQTAELQANRALAQELGRYAEQFSQLAQQIQPQRPNPALLQHDPQAFYALQAEYEAGVAQQHELQQRAHETAQEAQARAHYAEQAEHQAQYQILSESFPEYLDPTTGPKLQAELSAVARDVLKYPPELIAQARATDILAMRAVADLKVKADKYDGLMAKQMSKVRAAKGMPKVAKPGSPQAPGAARTQQYSQDRELARRGDRDAAVRVLDAHLNQSR